VSRADTAIRAGAGVTVLALAGIAGAISYSHMTGLAEAHGEHGWRGHAFPLSVDGVEVVASLVLLADRRAGRSSGLLPWAALVAGTAASFSANIAVGGADWIGRAVAGWPAFALLVAVKLLFGLLDHRSAVPVPTAHAGRPTASETVPVAHDAALNAGPDVGVGADGDVDGRPGSRTVPDGVDDGGDGGAARAGGAPPGVDVSALLPAARSAGATLARDGRALTREALARQLRAEGHAASNARVSALLKALNAESNGNVSISGNGRHDTAA